MRKLLIVLFFLCVSFLSYAQGWIGHTEVEIRKNFPNSKWFEPYLSEPDYLRDDNILILTDRDTQFEWAFLFDSDTKLCFVYKLVCPHQDINRVIKLLNEEYIPVSTTHWKLYDRGKWLYIYLKYDQKNDVTYFQYSDFED